MRFWNPSACIHVVLNYDKSGKVIEKDDIRVTAVASWKLNYETYYFRLTVKPTSAKQRSPSNRPSTVKTSNVANFPGQTKNQPPRRATTAASAAANRPPTSVNRGVSNPQKTSDRGGAAMKPTAIVGPESRRNNPTGLKSSNETRLEEELAQLRREKEEMMLLIQQMQQV